VLLVDEDAGDGALARLLLQIVLLLGPVLGLVQLDVERLQVAGQIERVEQLLGLLACLRCQ
jgi:hypothetical protein